MSKKYVVSFLKFSIMPDFRESLSHLNFFYSYFFFVYYWKLEWIWYFFISEIRTFNINIKSLWSYFLVLLGKIKSLKYKVIPLELKVHFLKTVSKSSFLYQIICTPFCIFLSNLMRGHY